MLEDDLLLSNERRLTVPAEEKEIRKRWSLKENVMLRSNSWHSVQNWKDEERKGDSLFTSIHFATVIAAVELIITCWVVN